MLKPITEYNKYFLEHSKKLYGFTEDGLIDINLESDDEEIVSLHDFFIIDNVIYINCSINENIGDKEEPDIAPINYLLKQENNKITEIESMPERPIQGNGTYKSKKWELQKVSFENGFTSHLFNLNFKGKAVFRKINGCYETKTGIIFNVLESEIPGKIEGLYFFPENRTSCSQIKEQGEIW